MKDIDERVKKRTEDDEKELKRKLKKSKFDPEKDDANKFRNEFFDIFNNKEELIAKMHLITTFIPFDRKYYFRQVQHLKLVIS